jgi:hypothetical protein
MENTINLSIGRMGSHGMWETRTKLSNFVQDNFEVLFNGACRTDRATTFGADDWAPRRIQIGFTRLHQGCGLKYCDGHKYTDLDSPTEEQLLQAARDIQILIQAYESDIPGPSFSIIF